MSDKKIAVTVIGCKQVSIYDYITVRDTRLFSVNRPIKDMLSWAGSLGIKKPTVNDLQMSEYHGDSI